MRYDGAVENSRPSLSPELEALTEQFCNRHQNVENYHLVYCLIFGFLRRLGLDPTSIGEGNGEGKWGRRLRRTLGWLCTLLLVLGISLFGPLVATAITDEWSIAPIANWAIIGGSLGILTVLIHAPLRRAVNSFLSLHRTMQNPEQIARLIAWERRWFRLRVATPVATLFGFGFLCYMYYLERYDGERPLAWGTAIVALLLLYQVGEIVYVILLISIESSILRDCDYALYRLSPLESTAVRRTLRGSSQIGLMGSFLVTLFIVGFVFLLEDRPIFINRVGLLLVALSYVAAFFGLISPRLAIKAIVQRAKERELLPLQRHLDAKLSDIQSLDEAQWKLVQRLKETHDAIRNASEEVLPLRALGRLFGALILPTATFLFSRFGEAFLRGMLR